MKRIIILLSSTIILSVILYLYITTNNNTDENNISKIKKEIKIERNKEKIKIERNKEKIKIKIISKEEHSSTIGIFEEIPKEYIETDFNPQKDIEPLLTYIEDSNKIDSLKIGDILDFPEINGVINLVQITKRVENKNSLIFEGKLINGNEDTFAVITKGKNRTFISLKTNENIYQLESKDSYGYVYNKKDIDNKRIDYSKTDELIRGKVDKKQGKNLTLINH